MKIIIQRRAFWRGFWDGLGFGPLWRALARWWRRVKRALDGEGEG